MNALEDMIDVSDVLNELLTLERRRRALTQRVHIESVPILQARATILQLASPALLAAVAAERALQALYMR